MQILFYIPDTMRDICFAADDMEKICNLGQTIIPETDNPRELPAFWAKNASKSEVVITGWDSPSITDEMLDMTTTLKFIIHAAGSVKGILPESTWARGIKVASANDVLARGVAETTLGMIIAGLKGFFPCSEHTRNNGWKNPIAARDGRIVPGFSVRELYNLNIGIIGAGAIGRHLIRLLQNFQVNILVHDPYLDEESIRSLGAEKVSLEQLLSRSDVVSLHAPIMDKTYKMISTDQLAIMKDDALFVNTARGWLVDENAFCEELKKGRFFAMLDVTYPEPPETSHPFRTLKNVVLLPHIAGAVSNGCERQGKTTLMQLMQYINGEEISGELKNGHNCISGKSQIQNLS